MVYNIRISPTFCAQYILLVLYFVYCYFQCLWGNGNYRIFTEKMTTENLVKHGFMRPLDMSLTENSNQLFLPVGCNRTQNLRFGPYSITAGVHSTRISFLQTMKPVSEVINLFFMLNSTNSDISTVNKN